MRFEIISDTLTPSLSTLDETMHELVALVVEQRAPRVEAAAKSNAPWTDRTSNARNGLHALASHAGPHHEIVLAHTVPYGIFLETRWSGRYAVILPTIKTQGRELMGDLRAIMGGRLG